MAHSTESEPSDSTTKRLATGWALIGVAAIFAWAVYRLGGRGIATVRAGLDPLEWAVLVISTVGFVYTEGVLTFDRRWIPKLVRRARGVRTKGPVFQLLAPLYGLSLVDTDPKQLFRGWGGTALIVMAVLIIRAFPSPWRGIVDFAVAAAMAWGLVTILRRTPEAMRASAGDG